MCNHRVDSSERLSLAIERAPGRESAHVSRVAPPPLSLSLSSHVSLARPAIAAERFESNVAIGTFNLVYIQSVGTAYCARRPENRDLKSEYPLATDII